MGNVSLVSVSDLSVTQTQRLSPSLIRSDRDEIELALWSCHSSESQACQCETLILLSPFLSDELHSLSQPLARPAALLMFSRAILSIKAAIWSWKKERSEWKKEGKQLSVHRPLLRLQWKQEGTVCILICGVLLCVLLLHLVFSLLFSSLLFSDVLFSFLYLSCAVIHVSAICHLLASFSFKLFSVVSLTFCLSLSLGSCY